MPNHAKKPNKNLSQTAAVVSEDRTEDYAEIIREDYLQDYVQAINEENNF